MTLSTSTSKALYNGNAATTEFSAPFRFFTNADLLVELVSSGGVSTTQVLDTDYTVTGAGDDAGGAVTMAVAPATGEVLVIRRVIAATQEVDYISGEAFPAETHEAALDRLTMIAQQNAEAAGRALTLPSSDTAGAELPSAPLRASKYLAFDADGAPVVVSGTGSSTPITPFAETLLDDTDAATARATLGATDTGSSLMTAANQAEAQTALGATATGSAVLTAADTAAARLAIGVPDSGPISGFRNLVINGRGRINQRKYVSGTATTVANQYTLDGWKVVTSGQNLAFSASGNGYVMTFPAGGADTIIRAVDVSGGTYVINWTGTATCTVNGTARAKLESFTLAANTAVTIRMSSGTGEKIQLEPGTVATVFEEVGEAIELLRCQRRFWRGLPAQSLNVPLYATGAVVCWPIQFTVAMANTPTLNSNLAGTSYVSLTGPSFDSATKNGGRFLLTGTAATQNATISFGANDYFEASDEP